MVFGQVVIGPPGSGETTYCNGMSHFLEFIGRKVAVINLDPANDALPYPLQFFSDPAKYVSALLLSLSTMIHMDLPHINVLSTIDLIQNYGKLAFNLDFYTDMEDLSYLVNELDQDPPSAKFRKLTKELCGVIEDYNAIFQNKESVGKLVKLIDKTNGYIFGGIEASAVEFSKIALTVGVVQEKYVKFDENFDDIE
ncbi:hypothetical protein M0R45_036572 [Rubus argutus]|uniref:GPN-loop GTPase 2 n=1 Tax=Rubus argutus TaxID=59490 RepID=A0AAW1VYA6_RUBAR